MEIYEIIIMCLITGSLYAMECTDIGSSGRGQQDGQRGKKRRLEGDEELSRQEDHSSVAKKRKQGVLVLLMEAIARIDVDEVRSILEANPDLDLNKEYESQTPLDVALFGLKDLAGAFKKLSLGKVSILTEEKYTPEQLAILEMLLARGAHINYVYNLRGTYVHEAVNSLNSKAFIFLLNNYAQPTIFDFHGRSALSLALAKLEEYILFIKSVSADWLEDLKELVATTAILKRMVVELLHRGMPLNFARHSFEGDFVNVLSIGDPELMRIISEKANEELGIPKECALCHQPFDLSRLEQIYECTSCYAHRTCAIADPEKITLCFACQCHSFKWHQKGFGK